MSESIFGNDFPEHAAVAYRLTPAACRATGGHAETGYVSHLLDGTTLVVCGACFTTFEREVPC